MIVIDELGLLNLSDIFLSASAFIPWLHVCLDGDATWRLVSIHSSSWHLELSLFFL